MNARAESIVRRLAQAGFTAYYAGGCVRDMLLNRPSKDIDIATNAPPERVQELFERVTDVQGKVFGVVRVMEGSETFEVAAFRRDGPYLDKRHPVTVTFSSPEEDARRRDFTINGLFYDPINRKVIDFVGGEADLAKKTIRAIGKAEERFAEDHLRLLRAVRFASKLGFEIEPATWSVLCAMATQTRSLAPERVRDELTGCFTGDHPQRALDLLNESGLLAVWLPEVAAQKGVAQPPQFHPEGDVYEHVRLMLKQMRQPTLELAWSVLLHDIGKSPAFKVDETGRIRFNEHETIGARMAGKIMQRLRFSNDQIEAVTAIIVNHMTFKDAMNMRLSTLKRLLARPYFEKELEMHRLDCLCSHEQLDIYHFLVQKKNELGEAQIKPPPLVTGSDVLALGLKPGPIVGKILAAIEEEQLEGKLQSREEALRRLAELVKATSS
ncbi:MAG: CCA tRNA nucleotidyltransferase [bacterium]